MSKKLEFFQAQYLGQTFCPDDIEEIKKEILHYKKQGADLIILTGGMSVDPDDLTPGAIRESGAKVVTYGVPVQPGNMLMMAYLGDTVLLGVPGCAMYYRTGRGPSSGQLDLVEDGPPLSREEEVAGHRVVGDAVQCKAGIVERGIVGSQAACVEGRDNLTTDGIDNDDRILAQYVGEDLPVHAFEFVEGHRRLAVERDVNRSRSLERLWIAKCQRRCSVAHHELVAVGAEPPALTFVDTLTGLGQRLDIGSDVHAGLPRGLEDFVPDDRQPFTEEGAVQRFDSVNLARSDLDVTSVRLAVQARALDQLPIMHFEALGECGWVVWMCCDNRHRQFTGERIRRSGLLAGVGIEFGGLRICFIFRLGRTCRAR